LDQDDDLNIKITHQSVHVYRFPVANPVVTSFGAMTSRPAVFVRIESSDGAIGWGVIFANWPAAGAEHRARLLIEDVSDLVLGQTFHRRDALFSELQRKTHIRALQCGEWGPFHHVIAGLDIAFYDLLARKSGLPLRLYLNPSAPDSVPTYASGIHIRQAEETIATCRLRGFTAFKVKVGFDLEADLRQLRQVVDGLRVGEQLFADANQAWDPGTAIAFLRAAQDFGLGWVEEPIAADAPDHQWEEVAQCTKIPLAGGENIAGLPAFRQAAQSGVFGVIQPDIAKWGGFTGCVSVCRAINEHGRRYCPHFLGGGIGLTASAHLLAAVGGDGLLEVDVNPNPIRETVGPMSEQTALDHLLLGQEPGLGILGIATELSEFVTLTIEKAA
jgi:D-galactarolactone cycloisomerase